MSRLPSRWVRTRSGSYGYVVRTAEGRYRIRWLAAGMLIAGQSTWTAEELLDSRLRFLKRKPAGAPSVGPAKSRAKKGRKPKDSNQ